MALLSRRVEVSEQRQKLAQKVSYVALFRNMCASGGGNACKPGGAEMSMLAIVSLIFDLTILQRTSSPKGCRGPPKLISSALSLFLATPAVYLLRLAAARAIATPLI